MKKLLVWACLGCNLPRDFGEKYDMSPRINPFGDLVGGFNNLEKYEFVNGKD